MTTEKGKIEVENLTSKELIEVIRNYKKSRIFFHWTYEFYIRELFEKLLNGEEDNENEEN